MTVKFFSSFLCVSLITMLIACQTISPHSDCNISSNISSQNFMNEKTSSEITSKVSSKNSSSASNPNPKPGAFKTVASKSAASKYVTSKSATSKYAASKAQISAPIPKKENINSSSNSQTASISSAPTSDTSSDLMPSKKETSPIYSDSYLGEIEQKLLDLINEERSDLGLNALNWNNQLYQSAKIRSDEMSESDAFSHTRPNGTSWDTTINAVGYSYFTIRENIIVAQNGVLGYGENVDKVADSLFTSWKNSSAHYEGIKDPNMKETGICVVYTDCDIYATQHFGDPMAG